MVEPNYRRSLWQLTINDRIYKLEVLGEVSWNPPEETQNVTVLKGAGGVGVKFDVFPEANVCSFNFPVVQETADEGILTGLALGEGAVRASFGRVNSDAAEQFQITRVSSDRAQIRFGGPLTWADGAQTAQFTMTCIGFTINRKDADSIVRL